MEPKGLFLCLQDSDNYEALYNIS